jgi:hypothetical protein
MLVTKQLQGLSPANAAALDRTAKKKLAFREKNGVDVVAKQKLAFREACQKGVGPCMHRCLVAIWRISQKASLLFYNINGDHMACASGCNGPFFLVLAGGGREGHCDHVGALTCLIYDARTRPMVVDSMD